MLTCIRTLQPEGQTNSVANSNTSASQRDKPIMWLTCTLQPVRGATNAVANSNTSASLRGKPITVANTHTPQH